MYHDNKSHIENIYQSVCRVEDKLMKLITHKNTIDIQTYPGPQLFQCILQVMSCRVEIPETNTHHHTHTPTKKSVSFIAGCVVAKRDKNQQLQLLLKTCCLFLYALKIGHFPNRTYLLDGQVSVPDRWGFTSQKPYKVSCMT